MVTFLARTKYSRKSIKMMIDQGMEGYRMYGTYDTDANDHRFSSMTTRQGNWSFKIMVTH